MPTQSPQSLTAQGFRPRPLWPTLCPFRSSSCYPRYSYLLTLLPVAGRELGKDHMAPELCMKYSQGVRSGRLFVIQMACHISLRK